MKFKMAVVLMMLCGPAYAERVVVGANAQHDRTVVYSWVDAEGNRHFTDDQRKAAKGSSKRVVHTPRPAYTPVRFVNPELPPAPVGSIPPPTSLPPSTLPPLPPGSGPE